MTPRFQTQLAALGYSEAEIQAKWNEAMAKADSNDPVFTAMSAMHPDENTAREEYALSQIEGLPPKNSSPASISSNPLQSDAVGNTGGIAATGNLPVVSSSSRNGDVQTSKYTPPSIDNDDLRKKVNETLAAMRTEKHKKTAATSIVKVLVKTPDPSTYLKVNGNPKNITISTDMEKITKFENSLEQTAENIETYRMLKAAADGKTPVPVYVNDENNRRIIGVVINTIGQSGAQEEMILSSKALEAFLLGQVSGIITNGQAYVRLANWKKKVRMSAGQATTTMTLTVQWTKKGYFWDNNMVDSVSLPMTNEQAEEIGAPSPFESRTVKTAQSFVVVEPNPNPVTRLKTPTRKRTIRLSGPCDEFPRFKMKPEYENAGITIGSSSTYISANMTPEDAAKYDEQFAALMMGYVNGEKFSQVDTLATVSPEAFARLTELRKSSIAAAAGYDGM